MGAPPHLLLRKRSSFLFLLPHPSPPPLKIIQHLIIMWVEIISDSYDENEAETPLSTFFSPGTTWCLVSHQNRLFRTLLGFIHKLFCLYFRWKFLQALIELELKINTWTMKLTLIWAMKIKHLSEYYSKCILNSISFWTQVNIYYILIKFQVANYAHKYGKLCK